MTVLYAVMRVLGRPVLLRAIAVGVAVCIPAFVLGAGNGLRASDVVGWMHRSLGARCLLWAGWLVLSGPALHTAFVAPGSLSLRALRLPRRQLVLGLFALCTLAEVPWAVLFARGAGPLAAGGVLTGSIALGAFAIGAFARPRGWGLVALGAAFIAWDPPALVFACVATVAVPFALLFALRNAVEQPGLRLKLTRPTSPMLALYAGHVLRLWRSERSRLSAALATTAAGTAGVLLSLRNDPSERPSQRMLIVMALPLVVAAAVCVAPLLENERRLRELLRSLRVRQRVVAGAFLLSMATPATALAATSGVIAGRYAQHTAIWYASGLAGWSLVLACTVGVWSRWLERQQKRSAGMFVAGVALIAVVATAGAYRW